MIVFGLAARDGFRQNRLVLVGVSAALTALISLLIVITDPFNANKALTWLSGSTYGQTWQNSLPVVTVLVVSLALLAPRSRELHLMSLEEDTPRLLGRALVRTRRAFLSLSMLLTATAIAAVAQTGLSGSSHRIWHVRSLVVAMPGCRSR